MTVGEEGWLVVFVCFTLFSSLLLSRLVTLVKSINLCMALCHFHVFSFQSESLRAGLYTQHRLTRALNASAGEIANN